MYAMMAQNPYMAHQAGHPYDNHYWMLNGYKTMGYPNQRQYGAGDVREPNRLPEESEIVNEWVKN